MTHLVALTKIKEINCSVKQRIITLAIKRSHHLEIVRKTIKYDI